MFQPLNPDICEVCSTPVFDHEWNKYHKASGEFVENINAMKGWPIGKFLMIYFDIT